MTHSRSSPKWAAAGTRLLFVLGVAVASPACGGSGAEQLCLFCFDVTTEPCLNATDWVVDGIGDRVDAPPGKAPAFVLATGLRQELHVSPQVARYDGCDEAIRSVRWITSHPETADFEAGKRPSYQWLVARQPGDTQVSAEVTLSNGGVFPAPLRSFLHGPIPIVRVVPSPGAAANRTVLLRGTVDLEGEFGNPLILKPSARLYQAFDVPTAGTIDMVVSWRAAANSVLSSVCQGETAFPLGCVSVIDGNRSAGTIPQVGSARTTPGRHTLWITNRGPGAEQVEYEIGLTEE